MRKSLTDIRTARRALELKEMPDAEFFAMPEFGEYLKDTLNAVCTRSRHIGLELFSKPSGTAAFTDGRTVYGNTACGFLKGLPDRNEKVYVLAGVIVHECGHVLFTDFKRASERMADFARGKIDADRDTEERLSRSAEGFRAYAFRYYRYLDNLIDDMYVESRIPLRFAGMPSFCLKKARAASYRNLRAFDAVTFMKQGTAANVLNALLMKAGGKVKWQDGHEPGKECPAEYAEFSLAYEKCAAIAETVLEARATPLTGERAVNGIFAVLYPFIEREWEGRKKAEEERRLEGKKNSGERDSKENTEDNTEDKEKGSREDKEHEPEGGDEAGNGGNPGEGGPAEGPGAEKKEEAKRNAGQAPEGETEEGGKEGGSDGEAGDRGGTGLTEGELREIEEGLVEDASGFLKELEESSGMPERPELDSAPARVTEGEVQETAEPCLKMACMELEREKRKREIEELRLKMAELGHAGLDITVTYPAPERKAYDEAYASVAALVERTERMLESVLKERRREGKITGLPAGRRIDCRKAYRDGSRIFTKRLVPDGDPDIAFGIVVDESGSMVKDGRYLDARKAAIALDAVLSGLSIPHEVTGHTASSKYPWVLIRKFSDPGAYVPGNMPYGLGGITHIDCNHDLCALVHMSQELKRRPEKRKVLLIISDGKPNAYLFKGEPACGAVRRFVEETERAGIPVIAAAIAGGDNGALKEIYGERRTLDISDPTQLPRALVKVMKRYVLARGD